MNRLFGLVTLLGLLTGCAKAEPTLTEEQAEDRLIRSRQAEGVFFQKQKDQQVSTNQEPPTPVYVPTPADLEDEKRLKKARQAEGAYFQKQNRPPE
jgi:hypothetical protein